MSTSAVSVGHEFERYEIAPISRTTLALFAGASGDHNPMHIDIDVARGAGLDDVFAHGMLSMAYLGRAVEHWLPQHELRSFRVRFSAITPVHASPVCTGTVRAVDADADGRACVQVELRVEIADRIETVRGDAVLTERGRTL